MSNAGFASQPAPAPGSQLARSLKEVANYPPHPPRTPTALYIKTHADLVFKRDLPCLVQSCGVRHSTLSDPAKRADPNLNPWGASANETHHHVLEDSLSNWADLGKFNRQVYPGLKRQHERRCAADPTLDPHKYDAPWADLDALKEWIHGDPDNMWVLCDLHHRHPYVGIHAITYPIWKAQDLIADGADLTGFHALTPHEAVQLTNLPQTTGQAQPPASDVPPVVVVTDAPVVVVPTADAPEVTA